MMIWPLDETLQIVGPSVSTTLVPTATWRQIRQLARRLPDAFSSYYLECRLGSDCAQVDFSASVAMATGGCEILATEGQRATQVEDQVNSFLWRRLWTLLQTWAAPNSLLYREIPLLWLEFDHVGNAETELPVPGLVFCLDPDYLQAGRDGGTINHRNTKQMQPFVETALTCLFAQPIASPIHQTLRRCFALLPEQGKLFYISVMLSRVPVALKISGTVPKDQFLAYLHRLEWCGSFPAMETLLATFATDSDTIRFDLSVDQGIMPRVGLEFFSGPQPQNHMARQHLLNQLVDAGLCTVAKRAAVEAWEGHSRTIYPQQSWPTRIKRSWYSKVVYQSDHTLEAKVYLGFMPGLFSPFQLSNGQPI